MAVNTPALGRSGLDPRVLAVAVGADLAVFVPVIAVYLIVGGATGIAALGGGVAAPLVGGFVAGRQPTSSPLTHGAVSAGGVAVTYVVLRVIDAVVRSRPVHPASVAILLIVATTVGTGGAWLGFRARMAASPS